jgi:DNA-directed RNA polymerase beta subunit
MITEYKALILVSLFFRAKNIINQHIWSYNNFIKYEIRNILFKSKSINIETPKTFTSAKKSSRIKINGYCLKFIQVLFFKPVIGNTNGKYFYLTPFESRLRNLKFFRNY